MAKDLGETKRIVFYETDDKQARFRIKLKQDGLRQSHFFRMIIALYIDNDQRVLDLVEEYKEKNKYRDRTNRRKVRKEIEKGQQKEKEFGLNPDEIESIFDLMEKEFPDL